MAPVLYRRWGVGVHGEDACAEVKALSMNSESLRNSDWDG